MASRIEQERLFRALIAELQPELQRAFLAAWDDIRNGINWDELKAALASGSIDAAIAALNIEPSAFEAYRAALTSAFAAGGSLAATTVNGPSGSKVAFRFDMTNPRAEEWIAKNVGLRIVGLADDAISVARQTILTGFQAGRHPNGIAVDIAGRVVDGRRMGGVVDLDQPRADRLLAVSRGMETAQGVQDLVEMRNGELVVRYKVNKATSQRILRAYHAGTAVPANERAISIQQYKNALLKARAETIARTETGQAVMSAKREEWHQACDKLGYSTDAVTKTWRHLQANNMQVRGLDTPFNLPNGAVMQHALDPAGGAEECANCTCDTTFYLDHTVGLT